MTAASTVVVSALLFFLLLRYSRRKREEKVAAGGGNAVAPQNNSFRRYGGNVKGLIVDENGLDVLYWKNLQEGENRTSFKKQYYKSLKEEQKEEEKRIVSERDRERRSKPPVQEAPLLRGKSSTSQSPSWTQKDDQIMEKAPSFSNTISFKVEKQVSSIQLMHNVAPPLPPPPGTSRPQPQVLALEAVPNEKKAAPPPPPPPLPSNKGPAPPPPPMKPPPPKSGPSKQRSSSAGEGSSNEKVKLKPLHWDKVNPNVEHSMVWDKIDKGSFK